jgi:lipoyl(octanoyl) transferase
VTSLADLGCPAAMAQVDAALRREFEALFGPTVDAAGTALPDAQQAAIETAGSRPRS